MGRVGRAHVPALVDYGFAKGGKHPYIVMEYLNGCQDGAAWLAEHGPLRLGLGLDLRCRIPATLETFETQRNSAKAASGSSLFPG